MIDNDKNMAPHKKYIIKEMRVMIYSLFLESYKTVTLACMAEEFGVSVPFLDKELSGLISSRRLNCKIDKVLGLIESQRIDQRNNLYKSALKQGEALLNRIQKLSRVGDV
jgi:26S proteasome regulatory subunit N7